MNTQSREIDNLQTKYLRCLDEVHSLDHQGQSDHRLIKQLSEQLHHLQEITTLHSDSLTTATQTLLAVQRELDTKNLQLHAINLTL